MSEELLQRGLLENPEKIGSWDFYNIGSTSIKSLKEAGIIRSIDYGNVSLKKVDGIITKQKEVIAVVEYKHPSKFNTAKKKDKAVLQEIEVAKKLNCSLIIATDTQETLWINVATGNNVKDKDGNEFKYPFDSKDSNLQKVISEIVQSINANNDKILPVKLVDPTDLAKQIWQDVWATTGATPENCLYTFVELFIFKYLSDLSILKGTHSFVNLIKMYDEEEEDKVVLKHYADVIRPHIKKLFPENPVDKTTIINGTVFVNKDEEAVDGYSTVFRKVLNKFKTYGELSHIDHDFKSNLFESFLKESISRKNWGQFFTPIKVVRAMNEMVADELKENMVICDPACGVGKFPLEYIKDSINKFFKIKNGKIHSKIKIVGFDKGFDKEEQKTIILAKANMLIYFCDLIKNNNKMTTEFAKIFNDSFILKTNSILGTLSEPKKEEYDLILTNPPYVTSGSSNLKDEISKSAKLKNHYKINAIGIEGLFIEWIIKSLKSNGKALIVVPDGIFNRQNDKNLRQYILDNCYIDAIISLPLRTFFTTPKKTYILAVTKKPEKSEKPDIQTDPVFTYLASEIGESRDVNRFDIEQDDLKEAVELFKSFKGNKKGFVNLNNDKRCKVYEIKEFKAEKNWSIDRWFSKEEKISIGIEDDIESISINDFNELINEIEAECKKFSNSLKSLKISDSPMKKIPLGSITDVVTGNNISKEYIETHKGEYPVYSSNTKQNGILGYMNTFDHNIECVQITTNGVNAGTVFYREQHKFSINSDARLYLPKDEDIDCQYLCYEMQKVLREHNFNWEYKPTIKKVNDLEVEIPITSAGKYDVKKQKEIVEKYNKIREIKIGIKTELERIENISVNVGLLDEDTG